MAIRTGVTNVNSPDYSIDGILKSIDTTPQKQPGTFRKVLGAVAGGVGNLALPGLGSVIGNAISGGGISGSSMPLLGDETAQYLRLQQQMMVEQRAFETASNIMKARHDAAMSAVRNIKQ